MKKNKIPRNQVPEVATRWWQDEWWHADEYRTAYEGQFSVVEVDRFVQAVAKVFNQNWMRSTRPHTAWRWLTVKGLHPLQSLISIGRNLIQTSDALGFPELCRDLRDPGTYESAVVELSVAAILREAGHIVRFHPPSRNGKSADVVAQFEDEEVFVEVKILREAQVNEMLEEFTSGVMVCIDEFLRQSQATLPGFQWRIHLEPDIADIFSQKSKGDPDFGEHHAESTLRQVAEHLRLKEYEFRIPEVGHFTFHPKGTMEDSGISHFPVSPRFELARILRDRLHGAIDQLPSHRPGMVIFRTAGEIHPETSVPEIQRVLRESPAPSCHVSAVAVLPVTYSSNQQWSLFCGFVVENQNATVQARSLRAFQALVNACNIEVRS